MSTVPLTVVAQVKAKPGKEAEVRAKLLSLVAPSQRDRGCLSYNLHSSKENPASFLFFENWTSKTDLDEHLQAAHVQSVLSSLGSLVAEPPQIRLWEKIG